MLLLPRELSAMTNDETQRKWISFSIGKRSFLGHSAIEETPLQQSSASRK